MSNKINIKMEFTILNNYVEYNYNKLTDNYSILLDKLSANNIIIDAGKIKTYLLIVCTVRFILFLTWKLVKSLGHLMNWKKGDDECCCGGGCSCCCGHNIAHKPKVITFSSIWFTERKWLRADVPLAWGLYFQDGATPSFEGVVDLHNRVMFYLVIILFGVSWVMLSLMWNFNKSENKLVYRYLNHGKFVPIQESFKFNCTLSKIFVRTYSTLSHKILNSNIKKNIIKFYEDVLNMRKSILIENKGKSGIYMLTNKLINDVYIGQSKDISKRFMNYFNFSYLISRNNYIISPGLIKYGYSNFSLTILGYCDKSDLLIREQYYFDMFNPQYNILKIAGTSRSFNHSEETKIKISKGLKDFYMKNKSSLCDRFHTKETKKLMSKKKNEIQ